MEGFPRQIRPPGLPQVHKPIATVSVGASPYSSSVTLSSPDYAPSPFLKTLPSTSTDNEISSNIQEPANSQHYIIYNALSSILECKTITLLLGKCRMYIFYVFLIKWLLLFT